MKYEDEWFGILSKSALIGLLDYYNKTESLLESDRKANLSAIAKQVNKISQERKLTEYEKFIEWSAQVDIEHEPMYGMFLPNFFRYSCIVLVYLVLGDHLDKLSRTLHKVRGNSKQPPDPGADIKTYKSYIDSFSLSYDESIWDFVEDLRRIRNCIVHASGDVSRRSSDQQLELRRIAKGNVGIHIGSEFNPNHLTPLYLDDDSITIEPRYCETMIHEVMKLIEALCKAAKLPTGIELER